MKRVFLDTNFLIDLFIREEYKENAQAVIDLCIDHDIDFYVSFLSVANFAYIMRKAPAPVLNSYINNICREFNILPNNDLQLSEASKILSSDFEDALQYVTALNGKCECIITRNEKDFTFSSIRILSPSKFIEFYS